MIKKLGERIRYIRKELKMTQEEFGKQIGVKGNTMTGYERGTRNPSDAIINSICLVYNINQTWLRTGDGDDIFLAEANREDEDSLEMLYSKYNCNALERNFLDAYFALKEQERYAFCAMIKKMFPSLSQIIGADPLAPTWYKVSNENNSQVSEKSISDLMQKPPAQLSDDEIKALSAEFERGIIEEKEAAEKLSVSSELTGLENKESKVI